MHNNEPFYCDTCDFETMNENTIQQHVSDVHKPANMSRLFFSQNKKKQTNETINKNKSAGSNPMPTTSPPRTQADDTQAHSGENFFCKEHVDKECEKRFSDKDHFDLHNVFYHGANPNQ